MILLKHFSTLNLLLTFPLFQNTPLTSHDPRGHAVMWTLHCFPVIFMFLVDMPSCGHFVVFFVILIFFVDTLSCGHFVVFLSFSYFSWTCCRVNTSLFSIILYSLWTCCHVDTSFFLLF